MTISETFAHNLRRSREAKGLSQAAVAQAADLDRTTIGQLERGKKNPTIRTVEKLATALGTTAIALLTNANGQQKSTPPPWSRFSDLRLMELQFHLINEATFLRVEDLDTICRYGPDPLTSERQKKEAIEHLHIALSIFAFTGASLYRPPLKSELKQLCNSIQEHCSALLQTLGYDTTLGPNTGAGVNAIVGLPTYKTRALKRAFDAHIDTKLVPEREGAIHRWNPFTDHYLVPNAPDPNLRFNPISDAAFRGKAMHVAGIQVSIEILRCHAEVALVHNSLSHHKISFSRAMGRALFLLLAQSFYSIYKVAPNVIDRERGRQGPAALWASHVLSRSYVRWTEYLLKDTTGKLDTFGAELELVTATLNRSRRLSLSTVGRRLDQAWREYEQTGYRLSDGPSGMK